MNKQQLLRLISLMGVAAALGVSVFLVGAQSLEPSQSSDSVVKVESDDVVLDNAIQRTNQGTKLSDGSCEFTTYIEKAPDAPAKLSRMLSVDYETCEATVEEGDVRPEDLDRLTQDDQHGSSGSPTGAYGADAFGAQQGPIYRTRFKTWYEDPADWTMNGVKSTVRWTVDSGKVWYYSSGSTCHHWKATGWSDRGGTCTNEYNSSQTRVEKDTTRTFTNSVFPCPLPGTATKVRYYENVAGGKVNGNSYGQSVSSSSGRCGSWLSKNTLLY